MRPAVHPTLVLFFKSLGVILGVGPALWAAPPIDKPKLSPDELLVRGQYDQVPRGTAGHGKAVWAFAAYHLAPNSEAGSAAKEAADAGDDLGRSILMRLHEEGRAFRRDEKLMWQLNHALREKLSKVEKPTPLQLYVLSQTQPANAKGVLQLPKDVKWEDFERQERDRRFKWLERAAKGGLAQACDQLGKHYQNEEDEKSAYQWYERAAGLGLASGYRNQGFLLLRGLGVEKDLAAAYRTTHEGAKRGDVFAMVNLAIMRDRGLGCDRDQTEARRWIERAATSGHYFGALEKGVALLKGHYGFAVDNEAAMKELRRALASRNREVLEMLAGWYAQGMFVKPDGAKAIALAEAAFVQGSRKAAPLLANIYENGLGGQKKDEKLAAFWTLQTNASFAFIAEQTGERPPILKRLDQLDPWAVKLD